MDNPAKLARSLRAAFESQIPKTWAHYFDRSTPWLTADSFAALVQEQALCSYQEAAAAVAEIVPELLAPYWETLAWTESLPSV